MENPQSKNGIFNWASGALSLILLLITLIVLSGWISGDTQSWSMWLSWVPAILLLPIAVIGLLTAAFVHGRVGRTLCFLQVVVLLFLGSWVMGSDWGMFRSHTTSEDDLVIVHWNATWSGDQSELERAYNAIRAADPDVVVITDPGKFGWGERGQKFLSEWPHQSRSAGVLLLSHEDVQEVRPIYRAGRVKLSYIQIKFDGQELPIWVLDLPSDPNLYRWPILQKVMAAARSANLPEPALVLGDLNVPRHSRALSKAFPQMENAFDEAGVGWGCSWPREWPLWQLDQVLVGKSMSSRRYEIINPHVGSHRMQRIVLRWTPTLQEMPEGQGSAR